MSEVYLLLGGNEGDVKGAIDRSIQMIKKEIGSVLKQSSLYQTEAWGYEDQRDFLNQAIQVKTTLSPKKVLEKTRKIEHELGRDRKKNEKWRERLIDIDILFYDDQKIKEKNLSIPHPRIQERRFTLEPMNEIASEFQHPEFQKSIQELLQECSDTLKVKRL